MSVVMIECFTLCSQVQTGDSVVLGKDLCGRNVVQLPPILCYVKCLIIITGIYLIRILKVSIKNFKGFRNVQKA